MVNFLRPILGRLVGALVAWLAAQAAIRWGWDIPTALQQEFVENLVNIIVLIITAYAVAHKGFDRWLNPGDAASGRLGEAEKVEAERLRRTRGL